MSKKARRRRVQQQRSSTASTLVQTEATVAPLPEKPVAPAAPDFQEYRYVITDLRRVGILAVAMFALLIALSFVIH